MAMWRDLFGSGRRPRGVGYFDIFKVILANLAQREGVCSPVSMCPTGREGLWWAGLTDACNHGS